MYNLVYIYILYIMYILYISCIHIYIYIPLYHIKSHILADTEPQGCEQIPAIPAITGSEIQEIGLVERAEKKRRVEPRKGKK